MPCAWALCDERGAVLQSGQDLLAAMPRGIGCVAILPAERVLTVSVKQPERGKRRWFTALPFVAEEFSLTDPGDNHVVPGACAADGKVLLCVVDKEWLRRISDAMETAKLSLRSVVAESLLSEPDPKKWILVWDGARGFLRFADGAVAVLDDGDDAMPPVALQLALGAHQGDLPETVEVRMNGTRDNGKNLPAWQVSARLVRGKPWDWRREAISRNTPNLLWGEFAPRARISAWWPRIRMILYVLMGALAIETMTAGVEWWRLSTEKTRLTKEMKQSFRTTFGESVALVNAPLQTRRALAALRHQVGKDDDGDFLPMLDSIASALADLPAGSLRGLQYESGRLALNLRLVRVADFQSLQQRLHQNGLEARLSEVRDSGNSAEARLTITVQEGR